MASEYTRVENCLKVNVLLQGPAIPHRSPPLYPAWNPGTIFDPLAFLYTQKEINVPQGGFRLQLCIISLCHLGPGSSSMNHWAPLEEIPYLFWPWTCHISSLGAQPLVEPVLASMPSKYDPPLSFFYSLTLWRKNISESMEAVQNVWKSAEQGGRSVPGRPKLEARGAIWPALAWMVKMGFVVRSCRQKAGIFFFQKWWKPYSHT